MIDAASRKVAELRIEHSPQGLAKLVNFLREIALIDQSANIIETKHGLPISGLPASSHFGRLCCKKKADLPEW